MSETSNVFSLTSPSLPENTPISPDQYLNDFGCTGANERPALCWQGTPDGTKSFAITFYDEDAPTGSGFGIGLPTTSHPARPSCPPIPCPREPRREIRTSAFPGILVPAHRLAVSIGIPSPFTRWIRKNWRRRKTPQRL